MSKITVTGQLTLTGGQLTAKETPIPPPSSARTLWSWATNSSGQSGLGDVIVRSSPVQVGALTNWSSIATGNSHSLAVKTDNTLWTWGNNYQGKLGDGTVTDRNSPVQVGVLTDWSSAESGNGHSLAVKTDGTLWAWGKNNIGYLALGNTTNYSVLFRLEF